MRVFLRAVALPALLVAALPACSPRGEAATRRAALAASRADSSAAGYAVGVLADAPAATASVSRHPASALASPLGVSPASTQVAAPARRDADRPRLALRVAAAATAAAAVHPDSMPAQAPIGAATRPSLPSPPSGRVRVNEFLSFDAGIRTAFLRIIAGYTGFNHALNFNGGAQGSQRVSVPEGWRVVVTFGNRDGDLPHSALVIRAIDPIPAEPPVPALAGASTTSVDDGITEGGADELSFVATAAGHYLIVCGVPGHAQDGQWIRFDIGAPTSLPSYQ